MSAKPELKGFCTLKQIATYYGVTTKTMKVKIEETGILTFDTGDRKTLYSPKEVEEIKKHLG